VWTDALTLTPTVLSISSVGYLAILALATLALTVRPGARGPAWISSSSWWQSSSTTRVPIP